MAKITELEDWRAKLEVGAKCCWVSSHRSGKSVTVQKREGAVRAIGDGVATIGGMRGGRTTAVRVDRLFPADFDPLRYMFFGK